MEYCFPRRLCQTVVGWGFAPRTSTPIDGTALRLTRRLHPPLCPRVKPAPDGEGGGEMSNDAHLRLRFQLWLDNPSGKCCAIWLEPLYILMVSAWCLSCAGTAPPARCTLRPGRAGGAALEGRESRDLEVCGVMGPYTVRQLTCLAASAKHFTSPPPHQRSTGLDEYSRGQRARLFRIKSLTPVCSCNAADYSVTYHERHHHNINPMTVLNSNHK